MIEIRTRTEASADLLAGEPLALTLIFQDRQRSRLRTVLSSGEEVALLLPRGTVLRGGDRLKLSDGRVALVRSAPEAVSTVRAALPLGEGAAPEAEQRALARAAYHLGNRHVPLEVGPGFLRYLHDHVLDAMVVELGLSVVCEEAPFEPESGAYGKHTHGVGHSHSHSHEHAHVDESGHGHGHGHAYVGKSALGLGAVVLGEQGGARRGR